MPWKPVPKKKILPKIPSDIEKVDSQNSKYWVNSNIKANNKVNNKPIILFLFLNKLLWDQVKVTPLLNKITVLNKGTPSGLIGLTPDGLQLPPNSTDGDKAESKKVQKTLIKNINSLNTNKPKENFKASKNFLLCLPDILSKPTK